uniref:NADH dehydrogenase subunit 4L n=1 Tax=Pedicinus obtusus TaxID=592408 RepID=A0A7L9CXB8_9NEOP|nr:NADH dehydrogenase subunit 4L [Pedicinus obtusus]
MIEHAIVSFYFMSMFSVCKSSSLVSVLISFELSSCSVYMLICMLTSKTMDFFFLSTYLVTLVCEGVLGLSILTSMCTTPGPLGSSMRGCSKF